MTETLILIDFLASLFPLFFTSFKSRKHGFLLGETQPLTNLIAVTLVHRYSTYSYISIDPVMHI